MRMPQAQEAVQLSPGGWSGQPASPRRNALRLLILPPELKRLLRDIDHGVGQRAEDFVAAGAVADLEYCAVKLFGRTHDIGSQKTGCKLKRASLLSESLGHKTGRGHPQDHEGNLAVSLAATRVIKVGELVLWLRRSRLCPVTWAYSCIAVSTSLKVSTAWPRRRSSSLIKSRHSIRFRDHDACAACNCSTALS